MSSAKEHCQIAPPELVPAPTPVKMPESQFLTDAAAIVAVTTRTDLQLDKSDESKVMVCGAVQTLGHFKGWIDAKVEVDTFAQHITMRDDSREHHIWMPFTSIQRIEATSRSPLEGVPVSQVELVLAGGDKIYLGTNLVTSQALLLCHILNRARAGLPVTSEL